MGEAISTVFAFSDPALVVPSEKEIGATGESAPAAASGPGRTERLILVAMILLLDSLLHLITMHIGGSWDQQSSPISQFVWFCIYVYALVGIFKARQRAAATFRMSIPLVLLVVLILLSSLWSTFPDLTAKRAFGLFGTCLIAYYIGCRFKLQEFLECLVAATAVSSAMSIFCILFVRKIGVMQNEYAGAWQGIYGHKNILAESMVLGILTVIPLVVNSTGRRRQWYVGLLVTFFALLVGSRSATSLLITAIMTSLTAIALVMRSKRFAGGAAFGLVLAAGVVAIVIPATGTDVQALFDLLGRDSTLTGRTDIWPYAEAAIGDRPLLGWGYKAFWLDDGPVQQYITTDWLPFHAHNGFLELSLDVGLIGTGIFVTALLLGFWRGMRSLMLERGPLVVWPLMTMICYVLSNITEASIAEYNAFQWVVFLVAFIYAMPQTKAKKQQDFGYGTVGESQTADLGFQRTGN